MLQELNQNTDMNEAKKDKLSIHHANVFHPKPPSITCMTERRHDLIAIVRDFTSFGEINEPLSIIEIYRIYPKFSPRLVQTLIDYQTITGIAWAGQKLFLTVSKEQTINLWSMKKGTKFLNIITDYGPIICMKYSEKHELLITGTAYGYAAAYKVSLKANSIEPISKMVKISSKIRTVDVNIVVNENFACRMLEPAPSEPKVVPKKRKRRHQKSEDDTEDSNPKEEKFLGSAEVTIYGATGSEVVIWDFHKKTIVDTIRVGEDSCQVFSIFALMNGDILVGDSKGNLSLFSHTTFTCRQTLKVLESSVLCIAVDDIQNTILVSGKEPTIVILRRQEAIGDEFLLFEKIEAHTHDVKCVTFTTRTEFFTGGVDGFMINCKLKEDKRALTLRKNITLPNYYNNVKFFDGEMMIQYDRSIVIWKLPNCTRPVITPPPNEHQPNPVKSLLLKARTYIHSSTFSDKWISYSTEKGIRLFRRLEGKLISHKLDRKLPSCSLLELCSSDRYLIACAGHGLYIIDLDNCGTTPSVSGVKEDPKFKVVAECYLKSNIRHAVSVKSKNLLVIGCGPLKSMIYTFTFDPCSKSILNQVAKFSIQHHEISFITYDVLHDTSIYVYTGKDQIIKIDSGEISEADIFQRFDKSESIKDLPDDANIIGMVIISKDHCILYDNHRMFKVDLQGNRVVNQSTDYDYIIKMDNCVFKKADEIALVELTPDDYRRALPSVKERNKFGQ